MSDELRDAMQRIGEYLTAHAQQVGRDEESDLIANLIYDDGRGGWPGELYASDLSLVLEALTEDE